MKFSHILSAWTPADAVENRMPATPVWRRGASRTGGGATRST
jgi:hypothetical protein